VKEMSGQSFGRLIWCVGWLVGWLVNVHS